jgi:hypothetical protein
VEEYKTVGSKETIAQIEKIKNYKLDLIDNHGQAVKWNDLYDINNKNTILRAIILDRKIRVDKCQVMADRPNFCAVTIKDEVIKRIEYYEGHDGLELLYDIRAKELVDKNISKYMEKDTMSYNFDSNFDILNYYCDLEEFNFMQNFGGKFKKIYRMVHEMVLQSRYDKKCKYPTRVSQTLAQHQYEFQKAFEAMLFW